ncbi:MAG: ROK family protein [Chitinophagaceae bacterium]
MDSQERLQNGVLRELYFGGTFSCAELSSRLNKSVPSVTKALNELVKRDIVENKGQGPSSGGRRPAGYSLLQGTRYIVAVAMDQLATRITMTDLLNNPLTETETFEMKLLDNDKSTEVLINKVRAHIEKSGVERKKIMGVGLGMPGFVNTREGINYSYLPSDGTSLQQYLEKHIGIPVWIDNDSSLVALAELKFGVARERESAMVVNIGWGIGLGIILNSEIFRGYNGYAGEFSHIPVREEGDLCICGKRGCLETEASLLVVTEKAIKEIKEGRISSLQHTVSNHPAVVGSAILKAANQGDQFAIELLSEMGYKIGKAIAILIHIMDPQTIILSGRGAVAGRILMTSIQNSLNKYCIPRLSANTEFCISKLGYKAELIGAAALVMENYGKHQEKERMSMVNF